MVVTGWIMLGAVFTAMPWLDGSLLDLALASAAGGFVRALSLAALNAVIIEHTSGAGASYRFCQRACRR